MVRIRPLPRWLVVALALLTVTAAVSAGLAASSSGPAAQHRYFVTTLPRAPRLVGLTGRAAIRSLEALDLRYVLAPTRSPRWVDGGVVVHQSPAPGTFVGIDEAVHLAVLPIPPGATTATVHLDRATVLPGPIDRGVVVITNFSGRVLHIRDCRNREGLVAGLTSSRVAYQPGPPLLGCHVIEPIRRGVTTLPTWVETTYQNCDTQGMPRCTAVGLSDLPAGTYRVLFPLAGLPATTTVPAVSVRVLQPTWLTSLKGAQGSLLVAASPCVGTAMVPTPPPSVRVVVIHHGRLVAERSVPYPGGTFTVPLSPGRYVVRSGAHIKATVAVVARRQAIADVRARCI